MTEPVTRYYIMESAVVPMLDKQMTYTPLVNYKTDVHVVPLVMAAEYARLEQECEDAKCQAELFKRAAEVFREDKEAALKQAAGLREALKEVTASLEWNAHGRCRGINDDPIMPSAMAVEFARKALSAKP